MPKVDIREQAKRKGLSFKEFSSIAGKKARGKRKRFKFTEKRVCRETRCQLWPVCFVKYLSATKYGGKCALFHMPERVQEVIQSSFMKGETGMDNKIIELLNELEIQMRKDTNPEKQIKLIKTLIDAKKSIYGDKRRLEANISGDDPFGIERMMGIIREKKEEDKK